MKCSQLHIRSLIHDVAQRATIFFLASARELLGLHALLLHFAELYLVGVPGMEGNISSFQAASRGFKQACRQLASLQALGKPV